MYGTQYVYVCEYVSGEPQLAVDSEEAKISALGQNTYHPEWLPLEKLSDDAVQFVSPGLRARIMKAVREGWPEQPEHFRHIQSSI